MDFSATAKFFLCEYGGVLFLRKFWHNHKNYRTLTKYGFEKFLSIERRFYLL
jgi:hypothetical protein